MKKLISGLLIVLAGSIAISAYFKLQKLNSFKGSRKAYEAFLHQSMAQLPAPEVNLKDIPKFDRPDLAAIQNYFQTIDPNLGYVPLARHYEAYLQTKEAESRMARKNLLAWEGTRADMGGRVRAIMFDPNDPQNKRVWAAGVTGGLWFTNDITNLNEDWFPVDDFWPNLSISSLAYDPVNTSIFYAGTGEAQTARIIYRESTGLGKGIMKSNDGGNTWSLLPSTMNFAYVTDIKVRNENGVGIIYAAVVSGVYQGATHTSMPSDGLYRSADGGNTWQQVLPVIPNQGTAVYAPAQIELAANGRIFVATMDNLNKKGGAVILHSDLGTAGSWTAFTNYNTLIAGESNYNIPARTMIAPAPSNPNIVYAQFSAGYIGTDFTLFRGRYMARSTDGGQTWATINKPSEDWSTLSWHAFALKVDPINPAVLYTGGLDLWKSSNSGQSWTKISNWALMYSGGGDAYAHADQHSIAFRPGNPQQAIFSTDGGIFLSNNMQLSIPTFKERNQNFNTLQFYTGAINPTAGSEQFLGGLQDNGTLRYNSNSLTISSMISGGDGAYCFWDQDEPNIYITSVYYNAYYIFKNNTQLNSVNLNNGTFVSPADYDYKNNRLFANAIGFSGTNPGRLLRINGIGSVLSNSLIELGTGNVIPFSSVRYSKFSPVGKSTLFVGTQSGRLYKVTEAQSIPLVNEIGSSAFPNANIASISIGGSEDTLLVAFSNYGVTSVWQTYNGGSTWQPREGNLPDMPIRWAIFHPNNSRQAMVATETGIWTTNMLGHNNPVWTPANTGMGLVRVDMLQLRESDNTVLAASHGRGMFRAKWNVDLYTGINTLSNEPSIAAFPNPAGNTLFIKGISLLDEQSIFQIFSTDGKMVSGGKLSNESNGVVKFSTHHLPKGSYIIQIQNKKKSHAIKFLKN